MNKLIVVVGCPSSRTHYTSCILLAHPQIRPPRNDKGGVYWAEPVSLDNALELGPFRGFLESCKDDYVVCNNHGWTFYLDLIKENCDCYVVETRRNYMDLFYRYVEASKKYEKTGEPRHWFCNTPQLFEAIRRAGEDLDPDSHWTERLAAYIFANRSECSRHRDTVLTEENYQRGILQIQIDLELDVVPFRELVEISDATSPPPHYKRRGYSLKWNPPKVSLDGKIVELMGRYEEHITFWLDKIKGLSN